MPLPMMVRSLICRFGGHSDIKRWSDARELLPEWEERTRLLARLVQPSSHILDFGAGSRTLQKYLTPDCTYLALDLVARSADTFVCDLNSRPLPDLSSFHIDTAVFGGVLEYMQNLPELVGWLSKYVQCCIASYECAQPPENFWQHLRQRKARASAGWVNNFQENEFVSLFEAQGLKLVRREMWHTKGGDEPLFVFQKELDCVCPRSSHAERQSIIPTIRR